MRVRFVLILLASAVPLAPLLHASDKSQQVRDRLKAAAERASLDGQALQSWHWKLDITVFDRDGKNPTTGNLEIWFSGGNMRTVASLGSSVITSLRIGDNLYRTAGEEKDIADLDYIQMQLLHPVPDEVFQPTTPVKLDRENAGKTKLDCIAPTLVRQTNDVVAIGRQFSFCLEKDMPSLLAMYEPGDYAVIRQQLGTFQSHEVPVDLKIFSGSTLRAEAKTTTLEAVPIDVSLFQVQPEMSSFTEAVEIPSGQPQGLALSHNAPSYPSEAKERHVSGSVVFDATIGTDGHIVSLQPVGPADPALAASATDAVTHWLYRPYLIDGVPVEVKTKITVNFDLGN
jgi:TonB family protein